MSTEFTSEAERVTVQLREEIISGDRREGSRLVERDVATRMGVSRVPVREALRALVTEGLVTPHPRTFTTVRRFTAGDVEDLIEVRSALEILAFRLAAERAAPRDLVRLEAAVRAEETAARHPDRARAQSAGAEFHRLVVAVTGNVLLEELYGATSSRMRWLLNQHDDLIEMATEHRSLYTAVAAGDAEAAAAQARIHLETSRRAALALRGRAGPPQEAAEE